MERFPEAHKPGYAVYSTKSLAIYDTLVLGLSNSFIWQCPSRRLVTLYSRCLSDLHLDIGVGTGYFLDKASFPTTQPNLTLFDPNAACLKSAAERVRRYQPSTLQADALVPWPRELGRFKSIALNYVLHCLPGVLAEKAVVFDHLLPHLEPGGIVFGATILQGDVPRSWAARKLMQFYNSKEVFSNESDTQEALQEILADRFVDFRIDLVGCVALFSARRADEASDHRVD